ncbi:hypothetical protein ACQKGC_03285 [Allorhizobium pseudoryzae]|uniref:hypothetical protein n=1 Tax=Allorhizobium pseudoryzae TaxID=379684 RepID=UPI003D042E2A
MPGNRVYSLALLLTSLTVFVVLPLDIAVPALVLSMMALVRWSVVPVDSMAMKGEAA